MTLRINSVYNAIATHFDETRTSIWACVKRFVEALPKDTLLLDVGCGNGKNTRYAQYSQSKTTIAFDICAPLLEQAQNHDHKDVHVRVPTPDYVRASILNIPFRHNSFDSAICIAVIHHINSPEQRKHTIINIANILKPKGRALITVWASEQPIKSKWIHTSNNDYMIPWLDKYSNETHYRYYHLFSEEDIRELINSIPAIIISDIYYEMGNWCVIIEKK